MKSGGKDLLLALDAGTTSIKAGLFTPDGNCLAIGREEYHLETPAADRAQLDPQVYWQASLKTIRQVITEAAIQPGQVKAMAVSSQGETTITMDDHGNVLYPALVWLDNRAVEQAARLADQFQHVVYQRTGIPEIIPTWSACKIIWLRQNEPDVFRQAAKFLLVQDYLIYRLTGKTITDGSISCTTLNYDLAAGTWWPEMLSAVGIRPSQLPEIVPPGTVVGNLSCEAASLLGLEAGTLVVNGGMDQSVGAIGAGNIQPGTISETTGAALTIQAAIQDPMQDGTRTMPVYTHSVPGNYLFVPVCPTAGMALKWLRDEFFQDALESARNAGSDPYDQLTSLAASIPAGADGLLMLPHLMGAFSPEVNPQARGSFTGFTLRHTRAHFVRALLEGVAFMLRRNLEVIGRTGIQIEEVRSTGGGARSPLWKQIKADVCNLPIVTLHNEETSLIGDAILAGVGCGIFPSIRAGCSSMVRVKERTLPGEDVSAYHAAYQGYCDLDQRLSEMYRQRSKVN
jgi:xylulokinase